jgi:fatty acid desaturase
MVEYTNDLMMAIVIGSTTLIAVTATISGQRNKVSEQSIYRKQFIAWMPRLARSSYLLGIGALLFAVLWFGIQLNSYVIMTLFFFFLQIIAFLALTDPVWAQRATPKKQ